MEYVLVTYIASRPVFVDGERCGMTNEVISVDGGTHTIDLGEPRDYQPRSRRPKVTGTTVVTPLRVEFQ